jgi:very-short-patch-repair endonuclease
MGIITKEVEVKPRGSMIQYYRNKGYEASYGQPLLVSVVDLPKRSSATIQVLCDICQKNEVSTTYCNYNKSIETTGSYSCGKCKYEKVRLTNIRRYGVDNYGKTKECHEKMKNTIKTLYGVEHYSKTQEYKDKFHNTCIDRYGESYGQKFAEKASESFHNKTGYDFPSQSPEVRKKIIKSCIEHYGTDNPAKSQEVREKMSKTLYANSSQKASKQQRYINNLYNGILNFPIKYYNADIYLSNDNLIIEYDGGFHLGNIITGRETQEEFNHKEIVRSKVIKDEGYKQMRIISTTDKLPSDIILLQMLSDAKSYFSQYPNHSWIEFDIDAFTVRNAEYKQGVPYQFGDLRTIKNVDLQLNNDN